MKTVLIALATVAVAFASVGAAEAKGKCVVTESEGTSMPLDFAKEKAAEILKDKLTAAKLKGTGKIAYTCEVDLFASTCKAKQLGCP